uniref:ribonuclease P n=1 Tax=Anopheles culicifacies TaxID=139723 RepID=A0A182MUU2_9DIPT
MCFRSNVFRLRKLVFTENVRYYAGIYQKNPQLKPATATIETIKAKLSDTNAPTAEEWKNIRLDILNERRFNNTNVDSVVLGLCPNLRIGKSYVSFLQQQGLQTNLAIVGKLLRLYRLKEDKISEEDEAEIWRIYTELREQNAILDANTCEHAINALTLTQHWKHCLELLEMIKITGTPDSSSYNCIATKAFQTGDETMGWQMLQEMCENKRIPNDDSFLAWLEYSRRQAGQCFSTNLERMLQFTNDNAVFLSKRIGNELLQLPKELGVSVAVTRITDNGKCSHCKGNLSSIVVSTDMFQRMKDTFLEAVLINKEIFNRTTPEELNRFQTFLKKTLPYDVVIDGLNVAFSSGNQKNPTVYAQQVAAVVRHYDDPFLLYAALESGPKTDFFSRDLMRKHSFMLGHELGGVFKRWQQEHQYSLLSIMPDGRVIIKAPFKYELYAHKSSANRWHVPLVEHGNRIPKVEKQNDWLCMSIA